MLGLYLDTFEKLHLKCTSVNPPFHTKYPPNLTRLIFAHEVIYNITKVISKVRIRA